MELSGGQLGKVDKNGRFFLPRRMLEELSVLAPGSRLGSHQGPPQGKDQGKDKGHPNLWLAPAVDPCLWLLDAPEYRRMQKRLRLQDFCERDLRKIQRKFSLLTHPETPDGQGRMQIPTPLRELAGITKEVLIIGTYQRIELWDPKTFEIFESGNGDLTMGRPNFGWKYDLEKVLLGDRK